MNVRAIETMSCKIKEGPTQEEFLSVCLQVKNELISKQPGFIARHITVSDDGTIYMFIHWESVKDMENSQQKLATEDLVKRFVGNMVPETIEMSNLTVVQ